MDKDNTEDSPTERIDDYLEKGFKAYQRLLQQVHQQMEELLLGRDVGSYKLIFRGHDQPVPKLMSGYRRKLWAKQEEACKGLRQKDWDRLIEAQHRKLLDEYYISSPIASPAMFGQLGAQAKDEPTVLIEARHHGADVGLIDFTSNLNVALWFACSHNWGEPQSTDTGGELLLYGIDLAAAQGRQSNFAHEDPQMKQTEGSKKPSAGLMRISFYDNRYDSQVRAKAQNSYFVLDDSHFQRSYARNHRKVPILYKEKRYLYYYLSEVLGLRRANIYPDELGAFSSTPI